MRRSIRRLLAAILPCTIALPIASLRADDAADKAACAEAYKGAQTHRKEGALKKAREELLLCASDRCPAFLQPDCVRWLSEVEAATPTIVFVAKGPDGDDVTDVRVSIDGAFAAASLDGKAIAIDPGSHKVKFERKGEAPIEESIVVREGDKARAVTASWEKKKKEPALLGTTSSSPSKVSSGPPAGAYVFGTIGLAGLATFGTFAAIGWSKRADLKSSCYGHCAQSDVDSVKTKFTIADVGLGVGVVSLGLAAYFFLDHGSSSSPPSHDVGSSSPVRFDVGAAPGGAFMSLRGAF